MDAGHVRYSCRSHFKAGGESHRVLDRLSTNGPMTLAQLRDAEQLFDPSEERRRHWYAVGALKDDRLIARFGDAYEITPKGREMLAWLSSKAAPDSKIGATSVRVFARPEQ